LTHEEICTFVENWCLDNKTDTVEWNYEENTHRSFDVPHVHVFLRCDLDSKILPAGREHGGWKESHEVVPSESETLPPDSEDAPRKFKALIEKWREGSHGGTGCGPLREHDRKRPLPALVSDYADSDGGPASSSEEEIAEEYEDLNIRPQKRRYSWGEQRPETKVHRVSESNSESNSPVPPQSDAGASDRAPR